MKSICLNMIVRNERARITRCLQALVKHIDYWVIMDTGSTDGTQEEIKTFFALHNKPGWLVEGKFENFEQARNDALEAARTYFRNKYDYILLCDADMELVVDDPNFRDKLTGPAHTVVQRAGTLAYHNTRFVARNTTGKYIGVTHEYLDVPSTPIDGVWFIDHADGANRKDKFVRDIALLTKALETEPNNARYWFYLAQSYRDAGMFKEASAAYLKRAEMGGWDEEAWNARVNYGHSLLAMKDEAGFIREMLAAYNMRPTRGESLYDLAKFYRERGMNNTCTLLAEAGMKMPYPNDVLFVSEFAYKTGFREEFAISAFYDPKKRDSGFRVCNYLTLDREVPAYSRDMAKRNLYHYLRPISDFASSFRAKRIEFDPGTDYVPMNPSVAVHGDQIFTTIRTVNYNITPDGRYEIRAADGSITDSNPIHTRNYLARLNDDLDIETVGEIREPDNQPKPAFMLVRGYEDPRLFSYRGSLWITACVREVAADGYCEQVLGRVRDDAHDYKIENDWRRILPLPRAYEKNWMPYVTKTGQLQYLYRADTVIDPFGQTLYKMKSHEMIEHMSGSSQLVPYYNGYLALVHEARPDPNGKRYYLHRFIYYHLNSRDELEVAKVSLPFVFHDRQIEFAAGMAAHPSRDELIISYGVRDKEAWLATMHHHDVWSLMP